jgi:hypothetical protein
MRRTASAFEPNTRTQPGKILVPGLEKWHGRGMAKQIAAPKPVAKSKVKTTATTRARATRPELRARKAAAAGVSTKALAAGAASPTSTATPRKLASKSSAMGLKKKTVGA